MNKINIWPFGEHKRITSVVGEREFIYKGELVKDFHKGWDVAMPIGSAIIPPDFGWLEFNWDKALGYFFVLWGELYRWNFWHLKEHSQASYDSFVLPYRLRVIEKISPLGYITTGNSGTSTAPHCHMQIARIDQAPGECVDPFEVFSQEIIDSLTFPEGTVVPEPIISLDDYEVTPTPILYSEAVMANIAGAITLLEDVRKLLWEEDNDA